MRRFDPLVRSAGALAGVFCAAALAVSAAPNSARATPNHAHYHYMVGSRANYAKTQAAILHHEASAPGLNLELARANAAEIERLAREIRYWLTRTEAAESKTEARTIAEQVANMAELAGGLEESAAELGGWLEEAAAAARAGELSSERESALRADVVHRCREIFRDFHTLLMNHKRAEIALGIPVPPEPPAP